ncbi:MAG: hypothetical protein ACTHKF_06720 [Candidatus Nitrosocosmicus sp.]
MVQYACPKCGEPHNAQPPDNTHRKLSRYPDRNTLSINVKCETCGSEYRLYWRS